MKYPKAQQKHICRTCGLELTNRQLKSHYNKDGTCKLLKKSISKESKICSLCFGMTTVGNEKRHQRSQICKKQALKKELQRKKMQFNTIPPSKTTLQIDRQALYAEDKIRKLFEQWKTKKDKTPKSSYLKDMKQTMSEERYDKLRLKFQANTQKSISKTYHIYQSIFGIESKVDLRNQMRQLFEYQQFRDQINPLIQILDCDRLRSQQLRNMFEKYEDQQKQKLKINQTKGGNPTTIQALIYIVVRNKLKTMRRVPLNFAFQRSVIELTDKIGLGKIESIRELVEIMCCYCWLNVCVTSTRIHNSMNCYQGVSLGDNHSACQIFVQNNMVLRNFLQQ